MTTTRLLYHSIGILLLIGHPIYHLHHHLLVELRLQLHLIVI